MLDNLYVIWRIERWHVVVTGVARAIASGDDREAMLACELAQNNDGAVHVYGKKGEAEVV